MTLRAPPHLSAARLRGPFRPLKKHVLKLPTLLFALAALAAPAPLLADDAEIHTFHCLHGCPLGAADTNDLVVREIYTLSSNDLTKFADWVAYRVTRETIGRSGGRKWEADPWLAPGETLEEGDYKDAPVPLRIDRGHQAPLASFSGTRHAADTNILSNITPQKAELNQGSWVRLENAERALAATRTVYVLTGPLYERWTAILPKADEVHRIPSGYWKVVAVLEGSATRLSAFIFEQETPRGADLCAMRKPLAEVEIRALLRFFPRLERRDFGSLDSDLGCRS